MKRKPESASDPTNAGAVDPLDEAIAAQDEMRKESAEQRDAKDLQLWQQWQANPTPTNMDPLINRFEPLMSSKARMWKAPVVNQAAFKTKLRIQAVDAFQTYDPKHPSQASLRTHVNKRLLPAQRFNIQQQNYAYMPEGQVSRIGAINQAQDTLFDELGREPTPVEIASWANERMTSNRKLTDKQVTRIMEGQRKDIIGSSFESDPTPHNIQREREIASLLRPSLNTDQQQVYDYLYGKNGKPKVTSTTAIAKALGKSPSQISRLRTGILSKFDEYS